MTKFDPTFLIDPIKVAKGEKPADLVLKNAHFLDVFSGAFIQGDVAIFDNQIVGTVDSYTGITEIDCSKEGLYIVPGFIDTHVHIESSLLTPEYFSKMVLPCGTTTAIWDPHEVANVAGSAGIQWALDSVKSLLLDVFVMLPSCVPATPKELGLETSGACLTASDLQAFQSHPQVLGLAEFMNYPGVLNCEPDVIEKLTLFQQSQIDGHCPGLRGKELNAYRVAGINNCHESISLEEAQEKLSKGIHVLIREGSAAKNAQELLPLINRFSSSALGLCSDDRNPLDVFEAGHLDGIINQGLAKGIDPTALFRTVSYGASLICNLKDRGAIAPGYKADLVCIQKNEVDSWLKGISVQKVIKNGKIVHPKKQTQSLQSSLTNYPFTKKSNLNIEKLSSNDLKIAPPGADTPNAQMKVIEVIPNQIYTNTAHHPVNYCSKNGILPDQRAGISKITVVERHTDKKQIGLGFVKGFDLKEGAMALSIAHDCHNVIALGTTDFNIISCINKLIEIDGGIVVYKNENEWASLPLPLFGLMSEGSPRDVQDALLRMKQLTKSLGCSLAEPFLQLSFLALPVIPEIKITDQGLVDVHNFVATSLLVQQ